MESFSKDFSACECLDIDGLNELDVCIDCEKTFLRLIPYSDLENGFESGSCEKNENIQEMYYKNVISKEVMISADYFIRKWERDNQPHKKYHECFAVYVASRKCGYPLTIREISSRFNVPIKSVTFLSKIINIDIPVLSCDVFITKICGQLQIPFLFEKTAKKIAEKVSQKLDAQPSILAASIISLVYVSHPLSEIASAAFTSIPTIKKWRKKVEEVCN